MDMLKENTKAPAFSLPFTILSDTELKAIKLIVREQSIIEDGD